MCHLGAVGALGRPLQLLVVHPLVVHPLVVHSLVVQASGLQWKSQLLVVHPLVVQVAGLPLQAPLEGVEQPVVEQPQKVQCRPLVGASIGRCG